MSTVSVRVEGGVARLVLFHPPLNIITRAVMADLRRELAALALDASLRAAVITAEGKHFSAGADVREHLPPHHAELIREFLHTVEVLDAFPVPIIAGVRGQCLGGAFELVQAVDLVVAGEHATFGQPEIRLGVLAPAACVLLPAKIPAAWARRLVYTGDFMTAQEAERGGLVARVVPDDETEAATMELAGRIARHSGAALRLAKRALRGAAAEARTAALRRVGELYVGELMETADALEGLRSFVEKRSPAWSHR